MTAQGMTFNSKVTLSNSILKCSSDYELFLTYMGSIFRFEQCNYVTSTCTCTGMWQEGKMIMFTIESANYFLHLHNNINEVH